MPERMTRFNYEIYCHDCMDEDERPVGPTGGINQHLITDAPRNKAEALRQARKHYRETGHTDMQGWQWDTFSVEVDPHDHHEA